MCHWSGAFIRWLESLISVRHPGPGVAYLTVCLDELKTQKLRISGLVKQLRHFLKQDPSAEKTVFLLRSIPGIGFLTAMTLYTEIIDINRFPTLDHLCSFAGIVPGSHSSAESDIDTGLTPRRNRHMRYLLVESSWIAVKKDPALLRCYTELIKTKKKQVVIIRIAKKLLNRVRFVWKNQKPYESMVVV
jgi:transposase